MCVVKLSVCHGKEEGHVRIDSRIRLIIFGGLKPSVMGLGAVEQIYRFVLQTQNTKSKT